MQNAVPSNMNMEKRIDHLKSFSSNIAGMVYELKDLIKIHEILIYKEKLRSTKKEQLQKHEDDLMALKLDLESIKKENEDMDGQLRKIEMKKDIDEMKNKCSKSLNQKPLLDHNLSKLAKQKQGSGAQVSTNRANRLSEHPVKVRKENTKGVIEESGKERTTASHRGLRYEPNSEANRVLEGLCN
ncbi:conserved Plasmodium protein, unknown function [Plasmodium knowlesi strain H]|uniref:Uncharacterized protein n=3 Tax=Plasmodium knowlesi TaxID=5850 RepID=A0A5E7WXW7_PLAKH|nr:conserved Plasmodium protein, unknown function [Plasmodium knowlesi strain H]OTN67371.1 Uncharacterized protein PKNOH_S06411000 [Plasmodium knowlesi]CAA9987385.1 conserved Plasmodium protein, unknown function [Plasmodium knowlesi strain H]SBO23319.1 conserved Plasmodium protein, unknown function [Plasmodium knowlesi strain H]SBO24394.1 conserved Plasmodium protein, unknown function [Plasmodium knowlesi strain H]VVS76859.1 conserved Plasmodium protein, unknown function [Plasmodium knowlesi s